MQHDGSHYVPFRDRNPGWISGKQLGKASKCRKSDVQGGADFTKAKKFQEKNMEPQGFGGYFFNDGNIKRKQRWGGRGGGGEGQK